MSKPLPCTNIVHRTKLTQHNSAHFLCMIVNSAPVAYNSPSKTTSWHLNPMNNTNDSRLDTNVQQLWETVQSALLQAQLPNNPLEELKTPIQAALRTAVSKLDVVTHDEFAAQQAVLLKTREKLEVLEKTVAELEKQVSEKQ